MRIVASLFTLHISWLERTTETPESGFLPCNRVEEKCGGVGDPLDSSVLGTKSGSLSTVSGTVGPLQSHSLLALPVRSHASLSLTATIVTHMLGRIAWPGLPRSPVQGPACRSLRDQMLPGCPQAPCPSDPLFPACGFRLLPCRGWSLGFGRCTTCKRTRCARAMPTWPRSPAPPRVLSLAAQGGREGASRSWVGLTLLRAPKPGEAVRMGVPSGPRAWNHTSAWLPPRPILHPPPPPSLSQQLFLVTALTRAPRGQGLPGGNRPKRAPKTAAPALGSSSLSQP